MKGNKKRRRNRINNRSEWKTTRSKVTDGYEIKEETIKR